jgi:hypothetical protein
LLCATEIDGIWNSKVEAWNQGDQTGRIFAPWSACLLWHFFKITFLLLFSQKQLYVNLVILTKYRLGYILGDVSKKHLVTLLGMNRRQSIDLSGLLHEFQVT